jgi:hypothetical protein
MYGLYYGEDCTVIVRESLLHGKYSHKWRTLPFVEVDVAVGVAATRAAHRRHEENAFPEPYPFGVEGIQKKVLDRQWSWLMPVFDATGRGEPIYVTSDELLRSGLRVSNVPGAHTVRMVHEKIRRLADSDVKINPKHLPPASPKKRQGWLGVDHFYEAADEFEAVKDKGWPLGIAPPYPEDEMMGREFEHAAKTWTVERIFEPVTEKAGWLYELHSEDGFITGLTQAAVEVVLDGRRPHDLVDWMARPVQYREALREVGASMQHPFSWSSHHRRRFLLDKTENTVDGDKVIVKEFRHGAYWITKYLYANGQFTVARRMEWSKWRRRLALNKMKSKRRKSDTEKLRELRDRLIPEPKDTTGKLKLLKKKLDDRKPPDKKEVKGKLEKLKEKKQDERNQNALEGLRKLSKLVQ